MFLSDAKQKIAQFSPQFSLKSLRLLGNGTDNSAYLANEEWIFRFPHELTTQNSLATETALLPQLCDSLPLKIPRFKYVAKAKDSLIYVGYPMLKGVALEKNTFGAMQINKQEQTLKDLASFMQNLHCFSVKLAKECGVREELYQGAYHQEQQQLCEQFQHLLSPEEIAKIKASFAAYENEGDNISYLPALLHADLKPEHILYDPENGHITGIIDWGDVCIGDPDYDFTCLYLYYDHNFVTRLLKYFPEKNHTQVLVKIQFFIMIRWLQDTALFYKRGDEKFVAYCLTNLRKHMQKNIL
jgi:aminoglycoside 2''-phosphotransferase